MGADAAGLSLPTIADHPQALTARQRQILTVIARAVQRSGREPTLREIGAELGGIADPTVFKHLAALERKGYLRHRANQRPSIKLLQSPAEHLASEAALALPVVGALSAAEPIAAADSPYEQVIVAADLAGRSAANVLLRVRGYGLSAEGLLDGDLLVLRPSALAEAGQTVVALLDGAYATIRRYAPAEGHVRLLPAQPGGEPIVVRHLAIYGIVLAVIRRLSQA